MTSCDFKQYKNKPIILFLTERKYRVARHIIFLLGFWLLLFYPRDFPENSPFHRIDIILIVYTVFILMFYVNMYVLVPFFFMRANYFFYLFFLIALVTAGLSSIAGVFNACIPDYPFPDETHGPKSFYEGAFISMLIIMVTTTVKLFQQWTKDIARIAEFKTHALDLELHVLRNQINPHFLFNMLNNVKALTRTNPEMAGSVIMKLSDFLRYQIYGNNDEKVLLVSEVEFLSNFLALEKIRRDDFAIDINMETDSARDSKNIFVPPNLFTTFVENAIKHSVDVYTEKSYIHINIDIKEDTLSFMCRNSISKEYKLPERTESGVGLTNIKRRLELLFDRQHHLDIQLSEQEFCVHLQVPISYR